MTRWLCLLALGAAGCGYVDMHEVVVRPGSGPPSSKVELYMMSQAPNRPYYEVALLQAIGHGSDANLEDVVHALTQRAAQLGCDAVIRVQFEQGYSMAHGVGACVRWVGQ